MRLRPLAPNGGAGKPVRVPSSRARLASPPRLSAAADGFECSRVSWSSTESSRSCSGRGTRAPLVASSSPRRSRSRAQRSKQFLLDGATRRPPRRWRPHATLEFAKAGARLAGVARHPVCSGKCPRERLLGTAQRPSSGKVARAVWVVEAVRPRHLYRCHADQTSRRPALTTSLRKTSISVAAFAGSGRCARSWCSGSRLNWRRRRSGQGTKLPT